MFWKRLSIWFLILTFSVMMAAPSFALAAPRLSTASNSNSFYSIMPLSTNVGYTFSAYSDGKAVPSGSSAPAWSKDLLLRFTSTGSYFECGSGLHIKAKLSNPWTVTSCQLQIRYTSGTTKYINAKFSDLFSVLSGGWAELHLPVMFEGQVNQIGILISGTGGTTLLSSNSIITDDAPVGLSLSGLYKGSNNVLLSRVSFPFNSLGVIPYHDIYPFYSEPKNHMQLALTGSPIDGVYFERGFEYYISFKSGITVNRVTVTYNGVSYNVSNFNQQSDLLSFTFEAPARMNASEVYFNLYPEKSTQFFPVRLIDIGSNYVPTDQSGSVSAGNTTIIKNIVTNINNTISNIQNTVSNISTQITNATTTITNTITNKVDQLQSSISSGLNNLGSMITGNADKNTDKITQSQKENTNKVIENQDKNTDKVTANQDKNTDTIVNGYDSSAIESENERLSGKLDEFGKAEDEVIGQISKPLKEFEFHNPVVQYLSTFQLFGNFMQDVFTGSGAFKDVINMSFIMSIALLVAGLYRFKGGN